ncbi:formyltransferase family protein [Nocardia brasiliensis]|uniref:formyltransferase family protein n=1 Tax=Nocardia brasiliensis TaxID=37326 RepID=UPI00367208E2
MKIVIAGRGRLAVRGAHLFSLLAHMTCRSAELVCVPSTDDDGTDGWRPSLRRAARANGWPIYDTIAALGLDSADLLVSLQYPTLIRIADLGGARAVNLHFALLPRHRGSLPCYWPIAGREQTVGVTLHELTKGVDAGPIIAARSFPLPEFTAAGDLFEMFHDHAFELLTAQARALIEGSYTARPQQDPGEPAHRRADVDFTQAEITDFARPAAEVRAECLAMTFPGFQLPTFRGRPVRNAYLLPHGLPGGEIGAIAAETKQAAVVSCADGFVCLEYATEEWSA